MDLFKYRLKSQRESCTVCRLLLKADQAVLEPCHKRGGKIAWHCYAPECAASVVLWYAALIIINL
jgi:hypothetical protein